MAIHFLNPSVREPFTFDSIGNHWAQPPVVRPQGYPFYHYLQTEKGRGIVEISGKKYTLNEGEGILIAPYLRHAYTGEGEEWITSFAAFTGTLAGSIDKMMGGRQTIFVEREQGTKNAALIDSILERWDALAADPAELSLCCYRLLLNLSDGANTRDLAQEPLYLRYVEPVIKEMETNYERPMTAQELSRGVYVTPQYLSRLFQRFLGCSVYEYLMAYRIGRARELLIFCPHLEVQQIAGQTGFSGTSHFISMFKKATGVTPLEFRRMNGWSAAHRRGADEKQQTAAGQGKTMR